MANAEHVKLIEMGADVVDAWLDNNPTQVLDLMGVDFRGKSLEGASLRRARLGSANLRGANLKNANLTQAVLHSTDLRGADLSGAKLFRAELLDTDVSEAIFRGTDLTRAKLSRLKGLDRATFKETLFVNAELHELDFTGAEMIEVDLSGADISHAFFDKANLAKANFLEAVTGENTSFRETRGLNRAKNLATIKPLISPRYFEYCHRSFFEQIMDWEKIRIFGKLPLFGPSYLALILIPAFFYGLGKYNDIVAIVRA